MAGGIKIYINLEGVWGVSVEVVSGPLGLQRGPQSSDLGWHLIHHFSVDQLLKNPSNLPQETLKKLPKIVQNLVEAWASEHPHLQSKQPSTHSQCGSSKRPSLLPPPSQTLPDQFSCLDWPPFPTVPITPKLRSFAMRLYNPPLHTLAHFGPSEVTSETAAHILLDCPLLETL